MRKDQVIEFVEWIEKNYYKGLNGYVPPIYSAYAPGKTIEELYDIFVDSLNTKQP